MTVDRRYDGVQPVVDRVIEAIESPCGDQRLLIVCRSDGCYSFRIQFRISETSSGPGVHAWPDGYAVEPGWDPPGPYLGIFGSAQTAKWEALGKIDWIASTKPSN